MMGRKRSNSAGMMVGLAVGTLIGVGCGMLLAPKTGREARHTIMNVVEEGKERSKRMTNSILEMGSEWFEDLGVRNRTKVQERVGGDIGYVIHEMLEEADVSLDERQEIREP